MLSVGARGEAAIPFLMEKWEDTVKELLAEIKDPSPTFSYGNSERRVYSHLEYPTENETRTASHFHPAASAKKRWLEWWQSSGREWYQH